MKLVAPGLWHWSARHPGIGDRVHSCFWEPGGALIDPMLPKEGAAWFARGGRKPRRILMTNRLHVRHTQELHRRYEIPILCHRAGLHAFGTDDEVTGFSHGARLPGGVRALKVGALCPEETAFLIPGGILALGDAVIRGGDGLAFVPDELIGEHPAAVKRGLREALRALLRRRFEHLLLAHGAPFIGNGKEILRGFLESQ